MGESAFRNLYTSSMDALNGEKANECVDVSWQGSRESLRARVRSSLRLQHDDIQGGVSAAAVVVVVRVEVSQDGVEVEHFMEGSVVVIDEPTGLQQGDSLIGRREAEVERNKGVELIRVE
jgi:hypothetical protein